jgi:hypothetical protein
MGELTDSPQNKWIVSDLDQEDGATGRRELTDDTEIVKHRTLLDAEAQWIEDEHDDEYESPTS